MTTTADPTAGSADAVYLAAERDWIEHAIAGSDVPARLAVLHVDEERGTRTVLVRFPDGWRRDAVGSQPAGEEMVILSGALTISGHTAAAGEYLVVEPRATREATSVADSTAAVVFFSGPGGGWVDGPWEGGGSIGTAPLETGVVRSERAGLLGSVEVLDDVAGRTLDVDADLVWLDPQRWLHLPAGTAAPALGGRCVVRRWA